MVSLKNLVFRVRMDESLLKKYPEKADMLKERIENNKRLIVRCVMENELNPILDELKIGE